jgi:hypothetical protein
VTGAGTAHGFGIGKDEREQHLSVRVLSES